MESTWLWSVLSKCSEFNQQLWNGAQGYDSIPSRIRRSCTSTIVCKQMFRPLPDFPGALKKTPVGKDATQHQFADVVKKWLRFAPFRQGGSGRRQHYKPTVEFICTDGTLWFTCRGSPFIWILSLCLNFVTVKVNITSHFKFNHIILFQMVEKHAFWA